MLMISPIDGLPEVEPGCDLALLLCDALSDLSAGAPKDSDVLVVTQKIVSKAEGCFVNLAEIEPSPEAMNLAEKVHKDPHFVELVLRESIAVVRAVPNVLITRHHSGHVMANAGIDRSNLGRNGSDWCLLLPKDADASAARLYRQIEEQLGASPAIVISDSFGRPWRNGVSQVAIGAAGLPALLDQRGEKDRDGRVLEVTQLGWGDMIANAAGLVMGEGSQGVPAALVRGLEFGTFIPRPAADLVRPVEEDLFR